MTAYDLVKKVLTEYPETRGNDKKLIWLVWLEAGYINPRGDHIFSGVSVITQNNFMFATAPDTIRRCRQIIQSKYPNLKADKKT